MTLKQSLKAAVVRATDDRGIARFVHVYKADLVRDGACNACTERRPDVTAVDLRTLGFRLCGPCRVELVRQLVEVP